MIHYIEGDIFQSPAQVIVNPVNTVGVMGKGLALVFKKRYPEMFLCYQRACEKNQLKIGKLMLWNGPDYQVLLFPTKENWRYPSQPEYIEQGLKKFRDRYIEKGITSIGFPRLGCGNGELKWEEVKSLMEKYLSDLPIDIYIYVGEINKYCTITEHKNQKEMWDWLKKNAKDMSFNGMKDDIIFRSSIVPYEFDCKGVHWTAIWKDKELLFSGPSKEEFRISEGDFFSLWDRIRRENIISLQKDSEKNQLVYDLLVSLGYLSHILIPGKTTEKSLYGYQINGGAGRLFRVGGDGMQ